jgi:hypothetical protein
MKLSLLENIPFPTGLSHRWIKYLMWKVTWWHFWNYGELCRRVSTSVENCLSEKLLMNDFSHQREIIHEGKITRWHFWNFYELYFTSVWHNKMIVMNVKSHAMFSKHEDTRDINIIRTYLDVFNFLLIKCHSICREFDF